MKITPTTPRMPVTNGRTTWLVPILPESKDPLHIAYVKADEGFREAQLARRMYAGDVREPQFRRVNRKAWACIKRAERAIKRVDTTDAGALQAAYCLLSKARDAASRTHQPLDWG